MQKLPPSSKPFNAKENMTNSDTMTCPVCNSVDQCKINTYKHHCFICNDCNSVFHVKKKKYLLSYILPTSLLKNILPRKAFLRLFSDDAGEASEFYDVYADECKDINDWRKSEFSQIIDELRLANLTLSEDSHVLDISGGPGYIGYQLKEICDRVVVSEFSQKSAQTISKQFGIETVTFDYTKHKLGEVVNGHFDLVMIRSSIIFCSNLDELVSDIKKLLKPNGHVLIETILPTYGEIFWWQQLEYKFPVIYSQETIEKFFYKNGFQLQAGFRDYGSYIGVKDRSYTAISRKVFTWLIELPMLYFYLTVNVFKKPAIDTTMRHKMLTQVWQLTEKIEKSPKAMYKNYNQGGKFKSKTFGFQYNGYLHDKNSVNS